MDKLSLCVSTSEKDKIIYDYLSFGYRLVKEDERGDKVNLDFVRNIPGPLNRSLRWCEKEYNRINSSYKKTKEIVFLILTWFFLHAAIFFMIFFLITPATIPAFLLIPEWVRWISVIALYIVMLIMLLLFIASITNRIDVRKHYNFYIRDITEEGYNLIRQRIILPKDDNIRKDGSEYHYIYNYFKNKRFE